MEIPRASCPFCLSWRDYVLEKPFYVESDVRIRFLDLGRGKYVLPHLRKEPSWTHGLCFLTISHT